MNGFLVVDKPAGITSHDVIAHLRRALGVRRIGHAGTLDPAATGVLLIGVGRGARLLRFLESHEKEYVAEVTFGQTTATEDADGPVLAEADASALTADDVRGVLPSFSGQIQQVPPMVSAVKVGGERLYRKARRGEEVARAQRSVTIHALELNAFQRGSRARAALRVVCSRGTYVRTLAADIGAVLGVGGHLSALRRTRVGAFGLDKAVALADATAARVRPMAEAVSGYPRHVIDPDRARALIDGTPLPAAGIDGPYAVFAGDQLLAMAEDRGEELRSLCVVAER